MPLPDDDKDAVERMISWLYTRKFELTVPVSKETSEERYMQLAKLNTLADKYDIYPLKNRIVDELFYLEKAPKKPYTVRTPSIAVITYVYNNTTEGSSFRKLMVAWYAYHIEFDWYDRDTTRGSLAEVSQAFAIDLVMALGARHKYPNRRSPFTLASSAYHETPPTKAGEDGAKQVPT